MITYRNFTKYMEYIQEDRRIYCFLTLQRNQVFDEIIDAFKMN